MSQTNVDFSDNPDGPGLMDDYLYPFQNNVLTTNSGSQRPSYAVEGTQWLDTSVTPWMLKIYDGTDDIVQGYIDPTNNLYTPAGVLPSQEGQSGKFLQTDGTKTVWNNALDYTNITNCITAIPQDIKLELNNGTLTLKAGSKVYYPNGVGMFGVLNIDSDIVLSSNFPNSSNLALYLYVNSKAFCVRPVSSGSSGTSDPGTNSTFYYNTATNIITDHSSNGLAQQVTFPVAIISSTSSGITSIDQVFNGFGYIDSIVFTLPGVEGLIPNGFVGKSRNNTEFTTTKVFTRNITNTNAKLYLFLNAGTIGTLGTAFNYDEYNNLNLNGSSPYYACNIGTISTDSTGRITSFNTKPVFQAQDYHTAARVDDNNVFTGNNTFSGTVNFEAQRAIFKEHAGEGGEFYVEIPKSKVDELGNYWNVDVNSSGNIRFYRVDGTVPDVVTLINAKTGVINYDKGTALSASDNSANVPTTAWVRGVSQRFVNYSSSVSVGVPTSTSMFTAPADGEWVGCIASNNESGTCSAYINGKISGYVSQNGGGYFGNKSPYSIPLKKGETLYFVASAGSPIKLPDTSNNSVFYSYI